MTEGYKMGSTFKPTATGTLSRIVISTPTSADYLVEVYAGNNPNSLGPVLGSYSLLPSNSNRDLVFDPPIPLTGGNDYLYIITVSNVTGTAYWLRRSGNVYPDGDNFSFYSGTFYVSTSFDNLFRTYMNLPYLKLDENGYVSIDANLLDNGSTDNCGGQSLLELFR